VSGPGAGELLRSLGLLVDGPVVWGNQVPGRRPGIFLVETSTPLDDAPIDYDSIRRWLERVPELTVDGERPEPRDLAQRLAGFWLPGEPIVFIGRARKAVGGRVAAMYATPLGDARPNATGHWLKTIANPSLLRVWWADTDAHEEYEDELLTQFAARVPDAVAATRRDPTVILPFANLSRPTGEAKAHGIANSLRDPAAPAAGATQPAVGARKAAPARRPPAVRQPRRSTAKATSAPAPAPTYVSAAGMDELTSELEHLRANVRPGVINRVKTARELGDLRENADYEAARNEQSFVEGRIQSLEALLRSAVVVEGGGQTDAVRVGSAVVVEIDGESSTWHIVGSSEADPARGRISYASPVGQALVGRRAGDEVTAQLPRGELTIRVVEVA